MAKTISYSSMSAGNVNVTQGILQSPLLFAFQWFRSRQFPRAAHQSGKFCMDSPLSAASAYLPRYDAPGVREHTWSLPLVFGNSPRQNHFPVLSAKTTSWEFPWMQGTRLTSIRYSHQYNSRFSLEKFLLVYFVVPGPGRSRASYNNCYYTKSPRMYICTHYCFIINMLQTQTANMDLCDRGHGPGMNRENALFNVVNKHLGFVHDRG